MRRSHSPALLLLLGLCYNVIAKSNVNDLSVLTFKVLKDNILNENFVVSPLSLHSVLITLLTGAGGNSAAEIMSLLGSDPIAVQNVYLTVVERSKGEHNEKIFNSTTQLFYRKGIEINDTFRNNAEKRFNVGFIEIDPTKGDAEVGQSLPNTADISVDKSEFSTSDMIVVNRITFQDNWKQVFHPYDTSDGDFYQAPENKTNAQFLVNKDAEVVAGKDDDLGVKWIHIPYKRGFKMVMILPTKRFGLVDLVQKMSADDFMAILKADAVKTTSIVLPVFDMIYSLPLHTTLKKMGVREIFTSHANLSGISKSLAPLKVDKIVQKSTISVDENGTKAMTKTVGSLEFHRGSLRFPDDAFFVADEPFLFVIAAEEIPIFAGMIFNPKNNPN